MNNDKLKKYVETKIALYQHEEGVSGKNFYDIGLSLFKYGEYLKLKEVRSKLDGIDYNLEG